ncbi:NAD(P)-binding domain-containing protein [Sorangium sp. So ce118]
MRLGMIGMGRMGSNMARRLLRGGHELVVYDVSPAARQAVAKDGAEAAGSLPELIAALEQLADRVLSAMRYELGGHVEKEA